MFDDLRQYINWLSDENLLTVVDKKVSSELEITEIVSRMIESGGPTLMFNNVDGNKIPVVANLFGSEIKVSNALGISNLNELYDKSNDIISLIDKENNSFKDKMNLLSDLFQMRKIKPKLVKKAPCHELIYEPEEFNLSHLPALKSWPSDGGKYLTSAMVISKNPINNKRNVGMYRIQIIDELNKQVLMVG